MHKLQLITSIMLTIHLLACKRYLALPLVAYIYQRYRGMLMGTYRLTVIIRNKSGSSVHVNNYTCLCVVSVCLSLSFL